MGFLESIFSIVMEVSGTGKASLKEAASYAPNRMGCYKIFWEGEAVYAGKAEDGLRKRFVQYYNGTTRHYSSANKIYEHRDELTVFWKVLSSRKECRELEKKWIEELPPDKWNKQRGWNS